MATTEPRMARGANGALILNTRGWSSRIAGVHSMCSVVWTVPLTPGNPAKGAAKAQMLVSFVGLGVLYQIRGKLH